MPLVAPHAKRIEVDVDATHGGQLDTTVACQQDMVEWAFHTTRSRWKREGRSGGGGVRIGEEATGQC
jgi:hypothetical protein